MLTETIRRFGMVRLGNALVLLALAIVVGGFLGCGKSNPVAQVSGKVVFKNGVMPPAGVRVVRLQPKDDNTTAARKGASGRINDDGTFEVFTRKPGDGVRLGKYAVTFAFWKGVTDKTSFIVPRYMDAKSTPYHLTVDKDMDGLEFELEAVNPAPR